MSRAKLNKHTFGLGASVPPRAYRPTVVAPPSLGENLWPMSRAVVPSQPATDWPIRLLLLWNKTSRVSQATTQPTIVHSSNPVSERFFLVQPIRPLFLTG